jgi:hypothetical protein
MMIQNQSDQVLQWKHLSYLHGFKDYTIAVKTPWRFLSSFIEELGLILHHYMKLSKEF